MSNPHISADDLRAALAFVVAHAATRPIMHLWVQDAPAEVLLTLNSLHWQAEATPRAESKSQQKRFAVQSGTCAECGMEGGLHYARCSHGP